MRPLTTLRQSLPVVLLCLLAMSAASCAGKSVTGTVKVDGLQEYTLKAMDTFQVPGLALVVVKDGKTLASAGFGVREVGKSAPVNTRTMFAIGSSSKAFTATALGMLQDEGKLSLSDPVEKVYPEFRVRDPWVSQRITLLDMLSHRTGVEGRDILWVWNAGYLSRDELVARLAECPEDLPFRAEWHYNNLMYLTAGQVIPQVTGTSWDAFVAERIFTPLGMSHSNTSITQLTGDNVATPHALSKGKPAPIPYRNIDNVAPAGAINSTIEDMEQWLRFQLANGKKGGKQLVSEEFMDAMRTSHFGLPFPPRGSRATPHARLGGYGLGWFLHDYRGELVVEHGGNIDGMTALVAMIPERQIGLVVLSNMQGSRIREALMYWIFDTLLGNEPEDWTGYFKQLADDSAEEFAEYQAEKLKTRDPGVHPSLALEDYAGVYSSPIYGDIRITVESGHRWLNLTYQSKTVKLEHWRQDTFRHPHYSVENLGIELVSFEVKGGRVVSLTDDIMEEFGRVDAE